MEAGHARIHAVIAIGNGEATMRDYDGGGSQLLAHGAEPGSREEGIPCPG